MGYHWHGEELLTVVDEWIGQHPLWAGMISFVCLIVALVIGALRQMFIRLMSLTCAIPMEDDTGRRFFSYVGDVPPFLWQYSPWFRAGTWCVVTGTSLIYALVGMELISALIGERFDLVFVLLLVLRWVISSIPSQLWIE